MDAATVAQNPFTQVGWLELIHIHPDHRFHPFIAKLDTGAETSSIDARDIEKFEKDGKKWIKLNLIDHNAKLFPYEAPLIRSVSIKRHGGKPLSREVITIPISRFGRTFAVEFSLADRSAFEYRVLLGRNFLSEAKWLVDSSQIFLHGDLAQFTKEETNLPLETNISLLELNKTSSPIHQKRLSFQSDSTSTEESCEKSYRTDSNSD